MFDTAKNGTACLTFTSGVCSDMAASRVIGMTPKRIRPIVPRVALFQIISSRFHESIEYLVQTNMLARPVFRQPDWAIT